MKGTDPGVPYCILAADGRLKVRGSSALLPTDVHITLPNTIGSGSLLSPELSSCPWALGLSNTSNAGWKAP